MDRQFSRPYLSRWRSSPSLRATGVLVCLLLLNLLAIGTSPVPSDKPASYPSWWFQRDVVPRVDSNNATPLWANQDYHAPDDFAAANLGQLKQIATAAYDEFNVNLPGQAGPALDTLIKGWFLTDTNGNFIPDANGQRQPLITPQTNDFAVLNLGQLKTVAQPFYDRLIAVSYIAGYPWAGSGSPSDDFAAANLGQLKYLFSFDLTYSSLGDGVPDWWKLAAGLKTNDPNAISALTGNTTLLVNGQPITYAQAYQMGTGAVTAATSDPVNSPPPGQGHPLQQMPTVSYAPIDVSTAYTQEDVNLVALDDTGRVGFYYIMPDNNGFRYTDNGASFYQGAYTLTEALLDNPEPAVFCTVQSVNSSGHLAGMYADGWEEMVMMDGNALSPDGNWMTSPVAYVPPGITINMGNSGLAMGVAGSYQFEMPADGSLQWISAWENFAPSIFSPSGVAAGADGYDANSVPNDFAVGDYNSFSSIGSLSPLAVNDKKQVVGDDKNVHDSTDCLSLWNGTTPQLLSSLLPSAYANKIRFPRNPIHAPPPEAWINTNGDIVVDAMVLNDSVPNSTTWVPCTLLWHNALNRDQSTLSFVSFPANASRNQFNAAGDFVGIVYEPATDHMAAVLITPVELAVDANRDGTIVLPEEQSNPANVGANNVPLPVDTTSIQAPFRFWWNNGIDGYDSVSDVPTSFTNVSIQADLDPNSPEYPNYQMGSVTCTRDLENFARLWLYTNGASSLSSGQVVVGLEWDSNTGDDTNGWATSDGFPAINLYLAAPKHGTSTNTGGADYLSDPATASDQAEADAFFGYGVSIGTVGRGTPFYFPASFFENVTASNPKSFFLFEGAAPGKGRLVTTLNRKNSDGTYTKIGTGGQVFMDIEDIKTLYERWTVGDGPSPNPYAPSVASFSYSGGGFPASQATINNLRLPYYAPTGFTYGSGASNPGLSLPGDPQGDQYILYVHGYNMEPWAKDAFAATMLKRLYWQGYKGKFGAYQWPDAYHTSDYGGLYDYDMSEYSAWLSALPFKNLVQQLATRYTGVYALGHSQGNVVIGEALRRASLSNQTLLSGYVASQAAVPVQCYDASQATPTGFFPPHGPTRRKTPNVFPNWMQNNGAASATIGNFFNTNDWALSNGVWQRDERLRPDKHAGLNPPYSFTGDINAVPVVNGFANNFRALLLANGTSINDQYEIMSFAAQGQCPALGTVSTDAQRIVSTDLTTLWGNDPYGRGFTDHVWHSAEFEFSNADQQNYWLAVLRRFGLTLQ